MHRRSYCRLALAALGSTSIAWSSTGHAASPEPPRWWVETRPSTCSAETGPLARQVQLACDATGRCALASDERSADRRAVLVCGDDGWTLEARDANDDPLWTLALGMTDDDARLRKAGVWIARSEGEAPTDEPPPATAASARPPVPPSLPVAPVEDRGPGDPRAARLSVAATFHGASPRANRDDYGWAWGGRAVLMGAAPRTTGPFIVGFAGTAEASSAYSLVRGGLMAGLDAAVGDVRFALSVEVGPALLRTPHAEDGSLTAEPRPDGSSHVVPRDAPSHLLPYAQASLVVEWSLPGPIHPIVSPSATGIIARGSDLQSPIPNAIVGLDVGFVWGQI